VRATALFRGNRRAAAFFVVMTPFDARVSRIRFFPQEVFAVTVLPGCRFPDLINEDQASLGNSFVVPAVALAEVSSAARTGNGRARMNSGTEPSDGS
jgi:hypothetical protein